MQHLVHDSDCCVRRNVGRTKINLATSNNLYPFCILYKRHNFNFNKKIHCCCRMTLQLLCGLRKYVIFNVFCCCKGIFRVLSHLSILFIFFLLFFFRNKLRYLILIYQKNCFGHSIGIYSKQHKFQEQNSYKSAKITEKLNLANLWMPTDPTKRCKIQT